MVFLTRSDPARKLNRFYIVRLAPTLYREWTLLREWGRSGSPSTVRLTSFDCYDAARKAGQRSVKRRLRHGYSERAP